MKRRGFITFVPLALLPKAMPAQDRAEVTQFYVYIDGKKVGAFYDPFRDKHNVYSVIVDGKDVKIRARRSREKRLDA